MLIWAIEAGVWMSAAAAVGFGMDPIEGLYIVALASVFSLVPSGPAYAGTQDAAAILGIKALGGTGAQAVAYIVMLRFIIVVPITIVGLVLLAARYGGLGRLRMARALMATDAPAGGDGGLAVAPPARRADRLRACSSSSRSALRLLDLGDRPFHHDESQDAYFSWTFLENGDYEYNPLLHGPLRFYLTAAIFKRVRRHDFTARLAPALMGTLMVPLPYLLRAPARPRRRVRGRASCSPSARRTCTSRASRARTSTSRRSPSRCWSSPSASSTSRGATSRR